MGESADPLQKLEEKLLKAVEIFKQSQAENRALKQELEKLRTESKERGKRWETLERELQTLRREREDVRNRIEKLLEQIEILTKAEPGG